MEQKNHRGLNERRRPAVSSELGVKRVFFDFHVNQGERLTESKNVFEFQPFTPVPPSPLGEFFGFHG